MKTEDGGVFSCPGQPIELPVVAYDSSHRLSLSQKSSKICTSGILAQSRTAVYGASFDASVSTFSERNSTTTRVDGRAKLSGSSTFRHKHWSRGKRRKPMVTCSAACSWQTKATSHYWSSGTYWTRNCATKLLLRKLRLFSQRLKNYLDAPTRWALSAKLREKCLCSRWPFGVALITRTVGSTPARDRIDRRNAEPRYFFHGKGSNYRGRCSPSAHTGPQRAIRYRSSKLSPLR